MFIRQLYNVAFDWLKSYTQFPGSNALMINILLKFQYILNILNFKIANNSLAKSLISDSMSYRM